MLLLHLSLGALAACIHHWNRLLLLLPQLMIDGIICQVGIVSNMASFSLGLQLLVRWSLVLELSLLLMMPDGWRRFHHATHHHSINWLILILSRHVVALNFIYFVIDRDLFLVVVMMLTIFKWRHPHVALILLNILWHHSALVGESAISPHLGVSAIIGV